MGLREVVVARGRANGLDAVGIADATPFERTRADLLERRQAGLHADMQFTYRDPDRSTDPSRTLPGARSLVVGAVRYASRIDEDDVEADRPGARVARYATGEHDGVLRRALASVALDLRHVGFRAVVLADDNALVDRAAAHRAGLGWFGKSSNLLLPGRGSWFVLGSVLTDAPLTRSPGPVEDGCGTCRRCIDACPTGAIVADGVVDAHRCLSWLLQSPGTFPHEHRVALGDRIYGCDDCQEVCPPNRRSDRRGEGAGAGGRAAAHGRIPGTDRIDVLWMLAAGDDDLLAAAGRWYVPRRDPDHLRRNALLVLGNTGDGADPVAIDALRTYLRHADDHLASHAAWAALRLGRPDLLDEDGVAGRPAVEDERSRWPGAPAPMPA
ncbi:tRNA epoxyqueuosine(34) reductase QueG [Dermatobacter hominis]|uniref:tRNA epoxyqueuosine(34) reductase QueG n=1 Tax=Dermatobacter hominis TaxID=2884263 RepID=UPI001D1265F2|nr:tRNA epoxyqueuosine(34) reductase QueG [Dermatobacter hominis]UDY35939.1 tRNA epoxyqueuosine(34) reductase QueG [Dermatobacter hominis]